jgi:hypothetical protein
VRMRYLLSTLTLMFAGAMVVTLSGQGTSVGVRRDGRHLFEKETFGGNGRTCLTCHSRETGTVSPQDAQRRFDANPNDPLFVHDGSDDFQGNGAERMLADATVLIRITLPSNVRLADDPLAKTVTLVRGIPTTLNTPGLDPVLMLDGRQPTLEAQAAGAIGDHAQPTSFPTGKDLERIKDFQLTDAFFSSPALRNFAHGGSAPVLPPGVTDSEKRGRRFFEDVVDFEDGKHGLCAACHAGPMLNETNLFLQIIGGPPPGTRFQTVLISELDTVNPPRDFIFTNPDNSETHVISPDPGRALFTGVGIESGLFDNINAFKIPTLWGVAKTAPYFHNNSAKTLEAVAAHYTTFFAIVTDIDGPGPEPPGIILTAQDRADMVAYMKLLK